MGETIIKICGLTRPDDVRSAIAHGAHFLGFIIDCNSPRRLSVHFAKRLSQPARGLAKRVAVTVNPSSSLIAQIAAHIQPDYIQLHGDETPAFTAKIKAVTGIAIIKAVAVQNASDLARAKPFAGIADYILLDAKPPKKTAQRGGHGIAFNWSLLEGFAPSTPYILAGGLTPQNIDAARRQSGTNIFDVSSGIEAAPGVKDAALIAQLMKAVQ